MNLRPCIDIHNGRVKQIVGGTLADAGDCAEENYVAEEDAAYFASLFKRDGLDGGHVILLNPSSSEHYAATRHQAALALSAWPGHLMAGGGVTPENAGSFIDDGAGHVIVTSYVFREGRIDRERLAEMERAVGKERLVLDLSCRKRDGRYIVVTDRWQRFTDTALTAELLSDLAAHCDEFLVHGVDVEGRSAGADEALIALLASFTDIPVTYAGGIRTFDDLDRIREISEGSVDVTIGSALSLYGGTLPYADVLRYFRERA